MTNISDGKLLENTVSKLEQLIRDDILNPLKAVEKHGLSHSLKSLEITLWSGNRGCGYLRLEEQPLSRFKLDECCVHFTYELHLGKYDTIFISGEDGGNMSRLPDRFSRPAKLSVHYDEMYYPLLGYLTRPRIPPNEVRTQLFVKDSHLSVTHSLGDPSVRDQRDVCILVDPKYADNFPQATYQPGQDHLCIHDIEAVPLLPKDFKRFKGTTLDIGFYNLESRHDFRAYMKYLDGLPLPITADWRLDYTTVRGTLLGRINTHIWTLQIYSSGYSADLNQQIDDTIRAANVLTEDL